MGGGITLCIRQLTAFCKANCTLSESLLSAAAIAIRDASGANAGNISLREQKIEAAPSEAEIRTSYNATTAAR